MHIVVALDSNRGYLKQLMVMLFSLCKHNQDSQIILHIIHTPDAKVLFQSQRELISHFVGTSTIILNYYSVDRSTISKLKLPVYNNLPLTTYFRLLIPSLLDQSIDRCLYLDSDMIIRKSIAPLYGIDFNSSDIVDGQGWVAGVMTNVLSDYMQNIQVSKYINAGMLLINLKVRRGLNISDQVVQFISHYPNGLLNKQPIMGDQCGINYICRDHIVSVEPQWNATPMRFGNYELGTMSYESLGYTKEQIFQAQQDPAILHFAGARKPCDWVSFHPRKLDWYRYLFQSGLIQVSDFFKYIFHIVTYPLRSDGTLFSFIKALKNKVL